MKAKVAEHFFAITAPGLERVCAGELQNLRMNGVNILPGGVEFSGELRDLYRANLWLRSASRVVVRVGQVKARDFADLFGRTARLPWGRFLRPGTSPQVRAVSHRSRLLHTGRIAETVEAAVARALGDPAPAGDDVQMILARFEDDICQLSVDSSGELLHRRGWRLSAGAAPLRETLAAGILQLLGWAGTISLADPMCGSGTFLIEAAGLARRQAPGISRRFAFMLWPGYRPGLWQALQHEARQAGVAAEAAIIGADRDSTVLDAAYENAKRAGVLGDLSLHCQELADLALPDGPGLIFSNPPYGRRLGGDDDLRQLFRLLGEVARRAGPEWRLAFLAPEERLAREVGFPLERVADLSNGGIAVTLYRTAGF